MISTTFRSSEMCPACGCFDTSGVLNSRSHKAGRLRRRKCERCEERWSTIEITVRDYSAM